MPGISNDDNGDPILTQNGEKISYPIYQYYVAVNGVSTDDELVIEDSFPSGRPQLEKAGLYFTDRTTVDKVEKMKVCTCLNPLHTSLAVFGCLLGYTLISKEMQDEELVKLVETIGYKEGLPVVINPGILDPKEFEWISRAYMKL